MKRSAKPQDSRFATALTESCHLARAMRSAKVRLDKLGRDYGEKQDRAAQRFEVLTDARVEGEMAKLAAEIDPLSLRAACEHGWIEPQVASQIVPLWPQVQAAVDAAVRAVPWPAAAVKGVPPTEWRRRIVEDLLLVEELLAGPCEGCAADPISGEADARLCKALARLSDRIREARSLGPAQDATGKLIDSEVSNAALARPLLKQLLRRPPTASVPDDCMRAKRWLQSVAQHAFDLIPTAERPPAPARSPRPHGGAGVDTPAPSRPWCIWWIGRVHAALNHRRPIPTEQEAPYAAALNGLDLIGTGGRVPELPEGDHDERWPHGRYDLEHPNPFTGAKEVMFWGWNPGEKSGGNGLPLRLMVEYTLNCARVLVGDVGVSSAVLRLPSKRPRRSKPRRAKAKKTAAQARNQPARSRVSRARPGIGPGAKKNRALHGGAGRALAARFTDEAHTKSDARFKKTLADAAPRIQAAQEAIAETAERLDAGPDLETVAVDSRKRPAKITRAEANVQARELLKADKSFAHKTARKWAAEIGCSLGLVAQLATWRAVQDHKSKSARGKRPTAVALSKAVEVNAGAEDPDTLNALIEEQERERRSEASGPPRVRKQV